MKSDENWSSGFGEGFKRLRDFIHVYNTGANADNPGGGGMGGRGGGANYNCN